MMKYNAGKLVDLDENSPTTIKISSNFNIVLIRRGDNAFALNDSCPHMGGPLGEGEIEEDEIICPWHFWRFKIETGECSEEGEPGATCFKVTIENGDVIIEVPKTSP